MKRTKKKRTSIKRTKKQTDKREFNMSKWISPIPRKIHFIWIGGKQPDYLQLFLKGFHTLNPEFQIRVWGNKELTKKHFPITYPYIQLCKKLQGQKIKEWPSAPTMFNTKEEAYKYSKWAQITDLMRLEIVYREGGYYFDTTFQCVKPLYPLLNCKEAFVGCNEVPQFSKVDFLSNSFFGSTKHNPILKRLLSLSKLNNIDFRSSNVAQESGPMYLRSGIQKKDDFKILPTTSLYPYIESWNGQDPPFRKASTDKCYGTKKTKHKLKLKGKGYLEIPCKKYPKSYAIKHWVLGKSWLIDHYYVKDGSKMKQVGGVVPACVPCVAAASTPVGAIGLAAGACLYGVNKVFKCTKEKKKSKKKGKKSTKKTTKKTTKKY